MSIHAFVAEDAPVEVVQRILRAHLKDLSATLRDMSSERLVKGDSSTNNSLWRIQLSWFGQGGEGGAAWVLKHWRQSMTAIEYGVREPVEALAWEHGLTRTEAMPPGMITPFVGAELAAGGREAWVMMHDVSEDLARCAAARTPEEVLARTRLILDLQARFHAHWEQRERSARLRQFDWLSSQESRLKRLTRFYRRFFGQIASPDPAWTDDPFVQALIRYGRAFMAWLPWNVRAQWEDHLCDRTAILAGFQGLPQTLSHGDVALKNIGLRQRDGETAWVLIDWEMAGLACPVLDAAKIVRWSKRIDLIPELSAHYLERYAAYGGDAPSSEAWERAFGLAYAQGCLVTYPLTAGMALEQGQEDAVRSEYEGIIEVLQRWLF